MKSINLWLPEVRVAVSGVDDPLIQQQLKATIREFFSRGMWIEELAPIVLSDAVARYALTAGPTAYPLHLVYATIDGEAVTILQEIPTGGTQRAVWVDATTDEVVVTPTPDSSVAGSELQLRALLKMCDACTDVPDRVYELFFDEILDGVKGRLFMMQSKPWSDRTLAAYHTKRFSAGIARARLFMRKNYSGQDRQWRFPGW